MKRFIKTVSVHLLAAVIVWFLGWILDLAWFSKHFDKSLTIILNAAAMATVISALACVILEFFLWKFSIGLAAITLLLFVVRMAAMGGLGFVFYKALVSGQTSTKIDMIAYVIVMFFFYCALLSAHVTTNIIDNRIEETTA